MRKIILIIFIILYRNFYGQISNVKDNTVNIATPETQNIMRFIDFPDIGFIGGTDVSIPIYNISFGEINIPIELSYNTKGNKVADIATDVGLGWKLIAGGNVSLKVNDMDDFTDQYSYYSTAVFEPEQALAFHRTTKGYLTPDDSKYPPELCSRVAEGYIQLEDCAPDFFYVNSPGFNDKFYLSIENDKYKANFSNHIDAKLSDLHITGIPKCQLFLSDAWGNSGSGLVKYSIDKLELINDNGYIYTFQEKESSLVKRNPQLFFNLESIYDSSWYLSSIQNPKTSKKIEFIYENYVNNYEHPSSISLLTGQPDFGNYPIKGLFAGTFSTNDGPMGNQTTSRFINPRRLKKIVFENGSVEFTYDFNRLDYPTQALTQVQVKDINNKIIKTVKLNFSYFGSIGNCTDNFLCKRLKLEGLYESSSGSYNFSYGNSNIKNDFPPRNSLKTDYLGFFNDNLAEINNNSSKIYFYPDLVKDNLIPFPLLNKTPYSVSQGVDESPNTKSLLGLLTKIIYPTNGKLELKYENDDYIYEGERYILGSSRVSEMVLYDENGNVAKETKYKYLNKDGKSSGQINFFTPPADLFTAEIPSGIGCGSSSVIGYSRILEIINGKGFIEKEYSNFNDYPDKNMDISSNDLSQSIKNYIKFFKFPISFVQNFDERRGKLRSISYYDNSQLTPIKIKKYDYTFREINFLDISKAISEYTTDPSHAYMNTYFATNKLVNYVNNLTFESEENFFPTGNIKDSINYEYDTTNNLLKSIKKNYAATEILSKLYYPYELGVQKLINKNILTTPLITEVYRSENGISKMIKKDETKYDNSANLLPISVLSYDLQNNANTKVTYDKYDDKKNILQYTTKSDIPTTIIWGYNQTQPIAKIEGATYAQVLSALGVSDYLFSDLYLKSNDDVDVATEQTFISALDSFRKNSTLSDYQITTYSYDPLIGVKSITPPSGIREIYKYDTDNRLQSVVDINGNILKEYKYKYAPTKYYNVEKSQTFTRNNCGSNYIGSIYNYIVPDGKYSSMVSQADADQKAQNDINANGQNAANTNGTCKPVISCAISMSFSGGGGVLETNAGYKASVSFSTGSSSINLPWSTGVKIGAIQGVCMPLVDYNSSNGQVYYTIRTNGDIMIRTQSGVLPNNTTYNYEFNYPKN